MLRSCLFLDGLKAGHYLPASSSFYVTPISPSAEETSRQWERERERQGRGMDAGAGISTSSELGIYSCYCVHGLPSSVLSLE